MLPGAGSAVGRRAPAGRRGRPLPGRTSRSRFPPSVITESSAPRRGDCAVPAMSGHVPRPDRPERRPAAALHRAAAAACTATCAGRSGGPCATGSTCSTTGSSRCSTGPGRSTGSSSPSSAARRSTGREPDTFTRRLFSLVGLGDAGAAAAGCACARPGDGRRGPAAERSSARSTTWPCSITPACSPSRPRNAAEPGDRCSATTSACRRGAAVPGPVAAPRAGRQTGLGSMGRRWALTPWPATRLGRAGQVPPPRRPADVPRVRGVPARPHADPARKALFLLAT